MKQCITYKKFAGGTDTIFDIEYPRKVPITDISSRGSDMTGRSILYKLI